MAIATLNGFPIKIRIGSLSQDEEIIGSQQERSLAGQLRDTHRTQKRNWNATIKVATLSDVSAWRQLLLGRGFHWSFGGDYLQDARLSSDWGVKEVPGYNAQLGTTSPAPKFGTYRLKVVSGTTLQYTLRYYANQNQWTIMWWFWDSVGTKWDHWALDDAGNVYKNGVFIVASVVSVGFTTTAFTQAAGGLSVNGNVFLIGSSSMTANTPADAFYDDLTFLRFRATAPMIASFASSGNAFSRMPRLLLSGALLQETSPIEVKSMVTKTSYYTGMFNGIWTNNAQQLEVKLVEY